MSDSLQLSKWQKNRTFGYGGSAPAVEPTPDPVYIVSDPSGEGVTITGTTKLSGQTLITGNTTIIGTIILSGANIVFSGGTGATSNMNIWSGGTRVLGPLMSFSGGIFNITATTVTISGGTNGIKMTTGGTIISGGLSANTGAQGVYLTHGELLSLYPGLTGLELP